jgi:hypothetical protein
MSKIALSGDASGTGTFTIASPNSNSNYTLTLPTATGTVVVSGTTPSLNGITFPATQVASADANTLDDYEEGTWSPIYNQDGGNPTVTYAGTFGVYRKIGSMVWVGGRISTTAVSGGSGAVSIAGLPFTVANLSDDFSALSVGVSFSTWNTNTYPTGGYPVRNSTKIILRTFNGSDARGGLDTQITALNASAAANGLVFSCVYVAA